MRTSALLLLLTACTEQGRVRSFGGAMKLDLPCGEKLVLVTWKEAQLWYATRPMRADEVPEVTTFREQAIYGILEGEIVVHECR